MALCTIEIGYFGSLSIETRQMKFLAVGINYFTKWVEAELLVKITQQNDKNFV